MTWRYVGNRNKNFQYVCLTADTKLDGDIGSILYVMSATPTYYINTDGATNWIEFYQPKLDT